MVYNKLKKKVFNILNKKYDETKIGKTKIKLIFNTFREPEPSGWITWISTDIKFGGHTFTAQNIFSDKQIDDTNYIFNQLNEKISTFIDDIKKNKVVLK